MEQSIEIIKNGIPELNDIDSKIMLLEMELNRLKIQQSQSTFKDFFLQFLKDRESEGKSIFQHKVRINKFYKFLEYLNIDKDSFLINSIDYEILYNYKVYCYNNGVSDFSFKSYLQGLKEVYNEAQKRKSLNIKTDNPFKDIVINLKLRREVNRDIGADNLIHYF
ncbi:MAG: phage integrase SAM-like domain-containing protein, partial [Bacilli bacterium]